MKKQFFILAIFMLNVFSLKCSGKEQNYIYFNYKKQAEIKKQQQNRKETNKYRQN